MITCSNCSNQNPDDAKFCQNCGHSLKIQCTNCQVMNDPDANFCKNCGHPLTPEPEESPEQQKQLSIIEPGRSERRFITILFCDIVGSTSIGERLDPEEWTEIMNGVFDRLLPEVERYGGTTARLMGDAVLALFGAPVAHEDDPFRAIRAALAMLESHDPYREQVREKLRSAGLQLKESEFNVRIGINTGLAIVGNVGSGHNQEYTAMGDAVNLAARMEQTAEPGTIQIAHDTCTAVSSLVELEPLDPIMVKGKQEPVRAFRVLGLKAPEVRQQVTLRGESPLVGRQQELNQLAATLAQLSAGSGGIVCLLGEGGIGKSRLVEELNKQFQDAHPGINWIKAESFSFEGSMAYGLIQRLLRRAGGIVRDDSPEGAGSKIAALLENLTPQDRMHYEDVFRILFGLEHRGEQSLQGKDFKREFFAGMRLLALDWAARTPTVMVFEDLHWTDAASVELINHLLSLVDEVPLLIICIFRPYTRSAAWTIKQQAESKLPHRYQEILLMPLTAEASISLISNLLNISQLPQEITALLEEKAAGVPYFIEEVVRDLQESSVLTPTSDKRMWQMNQDIADIHVPDNLEAVLVSRMDRLEPQTRHTLQLAAVIGRSFHYRVLKLVTKNNDQLDEQLRELQRVGMIRETTPMPDRQYIFRHVLAQEAAYNTILFSNRRLYHLLIGEAMENIFGSQLDEQATLLAFHFDQAGEELRALPYYKAAGESAFRLFANEQAMTHYERAIEIAGGHSPADHLPRESQQEQLTVGEILGQLHGSTGDLLMRLGDYPAAYEHYTRSLALLSDNDRFDKARVLVNIGNCWLNQYQFEEANQAFADAEQVIDRIQGHETREWILLWLSLKLAQAQLRYWQRWWEEMAVILDVIEGPIQQHGTLRQQAEFWSSRAQLLNRKQAFTPSEPAFTYILKALDLAERIGDKDLIANTRFSLGFQSLWNLEFEHAVDVFVDTLAQLEEIGALLLYNRVITYLIISLRFLGHEALVNEYLDKAMVTLREEGTALYEGTAKANYAWLAYRSERLDGAAALAVEAMDLWSDVDYPFQWLATWVLLAIALQRDDLQTAVMQASAILKPGQQWMPEPIANLLQSAVALWPENGKRKEVESSLNEAVTLAQENRYL